MKQPLLIPLILFSFSLFGGIDLQYKRLDLHSVEQLFAFHTLYPQTTQGKFALKRAWELLGATEEEATQLPLPELAFNQLIFKLISPENTSLLQLSEKQQNVIHKLRLKLPFYQKASFDFTQEFLSSLAENQYISPQEKVNLENLIDFIALFIHADLSKKPSDLEKIRKINHFIFDKMHIRFPPKKEGMQDAATFTSLDHILNSKRGICLGVSTLYLCIAQKLNLSLTIITPPGHIFIRYENGTTIRNIETTARGIHIPDERYLDINHTKLHRRPLKEVIGMNYFNIASSSIRKKEYAQALRCYIHAKEFLPKDPLLQEFTGYMLLLTGKKDEGIHMLKQSLLLGKKPGEIRGSPLIQDVINHHISPQILEFIFEDHEEDSVSIRARIAHWKKILESSPHCQHGWLELGFLYLNQGNLQKACNALSHFHQLNSHHPLVEFYLSTIHLHLWDFLGAWLHFNQLTKTLTPQQYFPKPYDQLKNRLLSQAPLGGKRQK